MFVYADNAATEKMRETALKTYEKTAREWYANPSSLHSAGQRTNECLQECRRQIAGVLGCDAKEIYFTSGGTEADNQAIYSAAQAGKRAGKKKILATAIEHHAVLHPLKKLEKEGFVIELLPVGQDGILSIETFKNALTPDTCLACVMFANNEIGTIQPVAEAGAVCKERGVLFLCDAVQAVGHVPVNVDEIHADYLTLSAHKFGGPKGVGALFVRTGAPLYPVLEGGAQERNKRAGTEDLPAIAAMAAALVQAEETMRAAGEKTARLHDYVIAGLRNIEHGALNGDEKKRLAGNVSFCFEGVEGETLLLLLDDMGVCASSGSACTSGSLDPSHVLLAIGRPHQVAHGSLRLTLNEDNTEEEAKYLVAAVTQAVNKTRAMSCLWRDLKEGRKSFIL